MKKSFTLAALLVVASAIAQSIVVVDMEEVLAQHPNTPSDKKVLEATIADYTKERNDLRANLEQKEAELERMIKEAQNPMLAPAKAEELRKACEYAYRELERAQMAAEAKMAERSRQLSEMEARLIKRTSEEIQLTIAKYAEVQGYDIVLYKNVVPYVKADYDITNEVILLCGGKLKTPDLGTPAEELKAPLSPNYAEQKSTTPAEPAPATDVNTPKQ